MVVKPPLSKLGDIAIAIVGTRDAYIYVEALG